MQHTLDDTTMYNSNPTPPLRARPLLHVVGFLAPLFSTACRYLYSPAAQLSPFFFLFLFFSRLLTPGTSDIHRVLHAFYGGVVLDLQHVQGSPRPGRDGVPRPAATRELV